MTLSTFSSDNAAVAVAPDETRTVSTTDVTLRQQSKQPRSMSGILRFARKGEVAVIGFVLVVLLVFEVGIRVSEPRLSKDLEMIRTFPAIAASLDSSQAEGRFRVLFLGNSLLREGVNAGIMADEISQNSGEPGFVIKALADGTELVEWYYEFKNCFANSGHVPDVLVLGFEGDDGSHLSDARNTDPAALGHLFCEFSNVPEVMQYKLTDHRDRMDFLLGSVSAAYANREPVQRRLLDAVIPNYQNTPNRMNDAMKECQSATPPKPTHERLARLIEVANGHNVQVVFVAIPVPNEYVVDPGLLEFASKREIPLIDARHIDGVQAEMFPDGLHMNSVAAARFSHVVGRQLPPRLGPR